MDRPLVGDLVITTEVVEAFLLSKGLDISTGVQYALTSFNIDTYEEVGDIFECGYYVLKTSETSVMEWYHKGYVLEDGESVFGVSLDLQTGKPVDVYRNTMRSAANHGDLEKTSQDGTKTITKSAGFADLPVEVQVLLADFPFKDAIRWYSEKPYGRFVEYKRTW